MCTYPFTSCRRSARQQPLHRCPTRLLGFFSPKATVGWLLRSTDSEAARRHDMVTRLRTRCDQMGSLLNRPAERNSLLAGLAAGAPAVETEQTAELDNRGLILMQRELMRGERFSLSTRPSS